MTYMQNDKITATVTFYTQSYDEMGVKYSLGKFYQKTISITGGGPSHYDRDYSFICTISQENLNLQAFVSGKDITDQDFGK